MKPTSRSPAQRAALVAILAVFILAGILYSLSTPFLDVSDEVRHYAMVEQLANGLGLPKQDPAHHGFYEQEGSQPPLYYALMAGVALPFNRSDFLRLAQFNPHALLGRADATSNWNQLLHTPAEDFPWHGTVLVVQVICLLGVLMGAVTVWCTYRLALELTPPALPDLWFVAPLAAAFTAFNPMYVFISASVNNDTLAAMLSSIGLLLGVLIIRRGITWRNAAALGLVLGGAALTKSSALALVAVVPLAIWVSEILRQSSEPAPFNRRVLRPVPQLALIGVLILGIAGWWYVRNAQLYNGDFTGTTMMATIAGARDHLPGIEELIGEWGGFRKAYWGLFGAVNIPMAEWIYSVFDGLQILAGLGLLIAGISIIKAMPRPRDRAAVWLAQALPARVISALTCLSVFLVAFGALIRWTSITLASQGRLLFPVIAVISAFMALGLGHLARTLNSAKAPLVGGAGRLARGALVILPLLLGSLTFACPFAYIRPAYATPAHLPSEAALPAGMQRTELRFGDSIRWIGYTVQTPRVQPGDEFIVTLFWQALKPMSTNYSAFIRLYGRNDTQLFLLDTYPGGGMYQTTLWQPGQVIADRYRLRIASTLTAEQQLPAVLRLDVGFWNFETKEFLNTTDAAGNPTGRQRYEVGAMARPVTSLAPSYPSLSQAKVAAAQVSQIGNTINFTITWVATADFDEDYTVFAHLMNSKGEKVAQADGRAAHNDFSAKWWRKNDVVIDPHIFSLPNGLPKGEYTIKYGLYRPADGARMPAYDVNLQPIDDAALSTPVTIR